MPYLPFFLNLQKFLERLLFFHVVIPSDYLLIATKKGELSLSITFFMHIFSSLIITHSFYF